MGRPSSFTPELASSICDRIEDGESLRAICAGDDMPDRRTVHRWLESNETFRHQYARAKDRQADAYVDAALEIAARREGDLIGYAEEVEIEGPDGAPVKRRRIVYDHESIQRAKLQVDTLKWAAARLAPKRWGDSSALTLQNPDGSALGFAGLVRAARVEVPVRDPAPAPPDEPI